VNNSSLRTQKRGFLKPCLVVILTTSATHDAEALHITRPVGEPTIKNTMIRLAIESDRDVDSFFAAARKNNQLFCHDM